MNEEEISALLEYVNEKKKEKAFVDFQQKQLEKEINEAELQLQGYLTDNNIDGYKQSGIYSFGWKVTTSNRFNQKAFGEDYPELLAKYKLQSESRKFEILINGR